MSESERTEAEREAARRAREAKRRQTKVLTDPGSPPSSSPSPATGQVASAPVPPAPPRNRLARSGGPRPPQLPLVGRSEPAPDRPGSSRHRLRWALLGGLAVVVIGVAWFLVSLFQPFSGSGQGRVEVVIPADASTSRVGSLLARDGVVSSGWFFKLRAELGGDHFTAGTYELRRGMSYGSALARLAQGPEAPPVTNVTIIPGKSRYQLNALLKSQGFRGDYLTATRRSRLLNPTVYGAPANLPSLEGFLYPDTYQLRKPVTVAALVADQLTQFRKEMATVNLSYARSRNLTAYDVLKIASLEDAEAALPSDLPKVASVIYNRLRVGMYLGLDTTAAYAANNYSGNLTTQQLDSRSPWNTLNHAGLPPTPIDSPDLAAIEAAAHPAHTDYLYFIVKVCGNGALAFTHSFTAFEALSRAYNRALAARGVDRAAFCGRHR